MLVRLLLAALLLVPIGGVPGAAPAQGSSGLFGLIAYQSQQAFERELPAATTAGPPPRTLARWGGAARPVLFQRVPTTSPRVIEISAERFEFWPSEITVAEGEEVELRLRSDDTMHGFRIVGAGTNLMIPKRGRGYAVARFTGHRAGRYTFECSRMCGAGHNFMRGVLIVRAGPGRNGP